MEGISPRCKQGSRAWRHSVWPIAHLQPLWAMTPWSAGETKVCHTQHTTRKTRTYVSCVYWHHIHTTKGSLVTINFVFDSWFSYFVFLCLVDRGGDNSSASKLKQVQAICGSSGAFAALKMDGTVESWGDEGHKSTQWLCSDLGTTAYTTSARWNEEAES